ncbi:hypothetical protein C2845_PM15G00130 [Panicum miliaceum]|uniref:Uncharacterized protein n=1 Tax=Panicum miliaceum TaxID=4540 RepID=A0A3L6Q8E9_PANMI|nr:hypothetical protein C2845_PM15G00130 [Panicum miliaceum]
MIFQKKFLVLSPKLCLNKLASPCVERSKKVNVYRWLTQPNMPSNVLERNWFSHREPWELSICGYVMRSCMILSGTLTIDLCDPIMRLWTYLDHRMYDDYVKYVEIHKQWRHFLPASFADVT